MKILQFLNSIKRAINHIILTYYFLVVVFNKYLIVFPVATHRYICQQIKKNEKDKTVFQNRLQPVRELKRMVQKFRNVVYPVLEFREKKQIFTKVKKIIWTTAGSLGGKGQAVQPTRPELAAYIYEHEVGRTKNQKKVRFTSLNCPKSRVFLSELQNRINHLP